MIKYIYVLLSYVLIAGSSAFAMQEEGPIHPKFLIKRSTVLEALNNLNGEKILDVKEHQYRVYAVAMGSFGETFKSDSTETPITCLLLSPGVWFTLLNAGTFIDDDGNFISEDGIISI